MSLSRDNYRELFLLPVNVVGSPVLFTTHLTRTFSAAIAVEPRITRYSARTAAPLLAAVLCRPLRRLLF